MLSLWSSSDITCCCCTLFSSILFLLSVSNIKLQRIHIIITVNIEMSTMGKLSIYRSIYVPAITYGYEVWVVTKNNEVVDLSGQLSGHGKELRHQEGAQEWKRSSFALERSQLRCFRPLTRKPPCGDGVQAGLFITFIYHTRPGNVFGSPRRGRLALVTVSPFIVCRLLGCKKAKNP